MAKIFIIVGLLIPTARLRLIFRQGSWEGDRKRLTWRIVVPGLFLVLWAPTDGLDRAQQRPVNYPQNRSAASAEPE
jgi:hypothetical protein